VVKIALRILLVISVIAWIFILSGGHPLLLTIFLVQKVMLFRHLVLEPQIYYWLPGWEGQLASGILLGGSTQFDPVVRNIYITTGLVHIVAASGFNVALIARTAEISLSRFINRLHVIPIVIVCIILYAILCGLQASIVRAALMSIAVYTGRLLGKPANVIWILLLTIVAMLIINFSYLTDIGFQLSVAATLGLVLWQPKNELQTTLVANAMVIPLIVHHFGQLSLYAIPANLLVAPVVAPITYLTGLGLLVGPVMWLAWPLLKYMNLVAQFFSILPYAKLAMPRISWWWVGLYYIVIATIYVRLKLLGSSRPDPSAKF